MITRRSVFEMLGVIPFLSFLGGKEEPKADVVMPKVDVVIVDGVFHFMSPEAKESFHSHWDDDELKATCELVDRLVEDRFVVETHETREDGTLTKELRYRL